MVVQDMHEAECYPAGGDYLPVPPEDHVISPENEGPENDLLGVGRKNRVENA